MGVADSREVDDPPHIGREPSCVEYGRVGADDAYDKPEFELYERRPYYSSEDPRQVELAGCSFPDPKLASNARSARFDR